MAMRDRSRSTASVISLSDLPLPIARAEPTRWLHRRGAIFLEEIGLIIHAHEAR